MIHNRLGLRSREVRSGQSTFRARQPLNATGGGMTCYLVQTMSSGDLSRITYFRRHPESHPYPDEKHRFTEDATLDYARLRGVAPSEVVAGKLILQQNALRGVSARELDVTHGIPLECDGHIQPA